jgi:hypothetical protein
MATLPSGPKTSACGSSREEVSLRREVELRSKVGPRHAGALMGNGTRQPHYVPNSYLAQFASPPGKEGMLFAYRTESRTSFSALPKNYARVRDLYRVVGDTPDALENLLSQMESELVPALERIESRAPERFDVLREIAFVALQAIRGQDTIERVKEFIRTS